MPVTRRIYVSLPADRWLPTHMNDLKWAIVDEIENLGYTPEIFTNPKGKPGLASSRAWGARDADEVVRRCSGAAVIGMARWNFKDPQGQDVRLPTEFCHYEGALARTLGLPTLVLGATVLDWQTDFIAGRSILAQIEEAASRCNAGIFLFTKDDDLIDHGQPDTTAPRDNVVFEAGYFIGLKGKRNVLIVREQGSKMPADLGGDIYALFQNKADIGPTVERVVAGFMAAL